jgi:leader peptidase (prepilin peptidase)/N-methyltransferase
MTVPTLTIAVVALFGLLIGSFLNVVIYRLPRRESLLFPSSHCPGCSTAIKPRHNVPVVGWLMLRGRCASCEMHISVRYPLVELFTGVAFAVVAAQFGLTAFLPFALVLVAADVAGALIAVDAWRARSARPAVGMAAADLAVSVGSPAAAGSPAAVAGSPAVGPAVGSSAGFRGHFARAARRPAQ